MMIKKKLAFFMVFCMIIAAFPAHKASAANIGDKLGNVLHSDIKAYINGNRIPCYNVNNNLAVVVSDLAYYGFDVVWDQASRSSSVTWNGSKTIQPLRVEDSSNRVGAVAFPYVYTDIVAYVNGRKVDSFNIQGQLVIYFSSLSAYGSVKWDGNTRESRLTINSSSSSSSSGGGLKIGDRLGDVLHSDIKAYINGNRIPCYNVNNQTAVVTGDLKNYGFDVTYDATRRTSTITYNPKKQVTPMTVTNSAGTPGTVAFPYVYTDIVAYVNGKKVDSYNINGQLVIYFSALSDFGTPEWDSVNRQSKLFTAFGVSGRISDSSGAGVAGTTIRLKNTQGSVIQTTYGSNNGTYSFSNVPTGTYVIEVSASGYTQATSSSFTASGETTQNLTMQKSNFIINGKITGSDAPAGIAAKVQLLNADKTVRATTTANSYGAYGFMNVPAGTYTVEASMDGYTMSSTSSFTLSTSLSNKDLTLQRDTHTVSGKISRSDSSAGIAATVQLRDMNNRVIASVNSNSAGNYSFANIPSGTYTLEAYADGYNTSTSSLTVSGNVTNGNVYLQRVGYSISGRITSSDNNYSALYRATVRLKNSSGSIVTSVYTDSYGDYIITGVSAGTYTIEAVMDGYATGTTASFTVSSSDVTGRSLTLNRGGYTVSGTIYYDNYSNAYSGYGLSGVTVYLKSYSTNSTVKTTTTSSTGTYSFTDVAAGTYYIEAVYSGYSTQTTGTFTVSGNMTVTNIYMQTGYLTISGVIRDSVSNAAVAATVYIYEANGRIVPTSIITNNGYYSFPGLPEGYYTLTVSSSTHGPQTRSFTLAQSQATQVQDFSLVANP